VHHNALHAAVEILLIDDNAGDVRLTTEALREGGVRAHLSVARNSGEALAFLHRQGAFAAAARPDLVLLDLNLPGKDGQTILAQIKYSPDLKTIPVIVLSTSTDARDVLGSYQHHANAYVVKSVDYDQFVQAMRSIDSFWLNHATLPGTAS
jgi:CheY-like chemotaxis protein